VAFLQQKYKRIVEKVEIAKRIEFNIGIKINEL